MIGPHRLPCETPAAHRADGVGGRATRWVLPATILGSSLSFVDGSVVNVALPAIGRGLQTNLAALQWVVNGYMLTFAGLILLGGAAGDRFGRRRVFLIGLVGFAASSAACGLAPSAAWLVALRLVQGAAAAFLVPASLAIIGSTHTGAARGPAIGTWAAAGALTTALGPMLGGWLVDAVHWRAIFFINLPIAAVALLLGLKLPSVPGGAQAGRLDARGALLAVLALALLSYGLIALGAGGRVVGAAAIAVALPVIWIFLRAEARAPAPMMPLSLFGNLSFSGANALTVVLYAALSASLFLLPFTLIEVHGYSAMAAGAAFLPFALIMGVGSRWSGGLVERFGARRPLVLGSAMTAVGYVLLALSGNEPDYWRAFLPGLVVIGAGMTLCVAPLTTAVLDAAPNERSGIASGINNAAARVGGLLAVAALGLAFGGTAGAALEPAAVAGAWRVVKFASAALAGCSAVIAAATIRRS